MELMERAERLDNDSLELLYALASYRTKIDLPCLELLRRTKETERLTREGFCVEAAGNYSCYVSNMSQPEIRQILESRGVVVPENELKLRGAWKKAWVYLQSVYAENPEIMESNFVVLDISAETKRKAYTIQRRFAKRFIYQDE